MCKQFTYKRDRSTRDSDNSTRMADSARLRTHIKQFVFDIATNRYRIRKQQVQQDLIAKPSCRRTSHCVSIIMGFAITRITLVWENGVRRVMRVAVVVVVVVVVVMMMVSVLVVVGSYQGSAQKRALLLSQVPVRVRIVVVLVLRLLVIRFRGLRTLDRRYGRARDVLLSTHQNPSVPRHYFSLSLLSRLVLVVYQRCCYNTPVIITKERDLFLLGQSAFVKHYSLY